MGTQAYCFQKFGYGNTTLSLKLLTILEAYFLQTSHCFENWNCQALFRAIITAYKPIETK